MRALILVGSLALTASTLVAQAAPDPLAPQRAEEPLGTRYDELNAAFTPDGGTVYFTRRIADRFGVILVARRRGSGWSTPEVASFSGEYADFDPFVTVDGRRLYWISNRPVDGRPRTDFDIWMVEREGAGWGAPIHLEAPINSADGEFYPTLTADGTLYFSSNRAGGMGRGDLYLSRVENGRFTAPVPLGEVVNSTGFDGDPYIAPDESYLVFTGWGRPEGDPDGDLYITTKVDGVWTTPRALGHGINSPAQEYAPIVSPDGRWLYFSSYRSILDGPRSRPLTGAEVTRMLDGPADGHGTNYRVPIEAIRQ
jgi:Tol biopolymer transport system component